MEGRTIFFYLLVTSLPALSIQLLYASQMPEVSVSDNVGDIANIIGSISRMSERNVDIFLSAIGPAVTDPALEEFQAKTQAALGRQVVYNVESAFNIRDLAQMLTDVTLECNTTAASCNNSSIEEPIFQGPNTVARNQTAVFTCVFPLLLRCESLTLMNLENGKGCRGVWSQRDGIWQTEVTIPDPRYYCQIYEMQPFNETIMTLAIRNTGFEDQGDYRCNNSSNTHSLMLYEEEQPVLTLTPSTLVFEKGQTVDLICDTNPSFSRFNLEWLMDGVRILENVTSYQIIKANNSIAVRSLITMVLGDVVNGTTFACMGYNIKTPNITVMESKVIEIITVETHGELPDCFIISVISAGAGFVLSATLACMGAVVAAGRPLTAEERRNRLIARNAQAERERRRRPDDGNPPLVPI